jgi:hypothetical protein
MNDENIFPDPPEFSDEDIKYCKESGDYKLMMFEWYKFVTSLGTTVVYLLPSSPAFREIPEQHYHVLVGLLNRCVRLMVSNVALSHERKFGEATAIIDRCIFESAIKLIWLCEKRSQGEFSRYLAEGLRAEIEFKKYITDNIIANSGDILPIEARMLRSIDRHIETSGLSTEEISASKRSRNLADIIDNLGYGRRLYIAGQRMGSHHVHGTWPSLFLHYLQERKEPGIFALEPHSEDIDTHINQFMFVPSIVLQAMSSYIRYVVEEAQAEAMLDIFEATGQQIMGVYEEAGHNAR